MQSSDGPRFIRGSVDGGHELRSIDAGLSAIHHVVSLPDGRIAIGGNGSLAVLNLDGAAVCSWTIAADLDGEPAWELRRAQQFSGESSAKPAAGRFPHLTDAAAAPDGSMLATGFSNDVLSYLLVGAGNCGGGASGG